MCFRKHYVSRVVDGEAETEGNLESRLGQSFVGREGYRKLQQCSQSFRRGLGVETPKSDFLRQRVRSLEGKERGRMKRRPAFEELPHARIHP